MQRSNISVIQAINWGISLHQKMDSRQMTVVSGIVKTVDTVLGLNPKVLGVCKFNYI